MTGDQDSGRGGAARSRPSFLPPDDGPAPRDAPEPVPAAPGRPPRRGAGWNAAMIVAAALLLVAAFLPWARVQVVVDLFGRPLSRDLGSVAGIDADDLVVAVPVLAVVAIVLAVWDLLGGDARIGGLAAVPGVLALLACGLFVLRLGDVRDDLPAGRDLPGDGLDVGYQISVRYGWYLGVAAALLLVGFSLARPIGERLLSPRAAAPGAHPDQHYPPQAYPDQAYPDQAYPDQAYAQQQYSDQQYYVDPQYQQQWAEWAQSDPQHAAAWPDHAPEQAPEQAPEHAPEQTADRTGEKAAGAEPAAEKRRDDQS
ncbi:hypothetical protein [Actinomadura fibrosa]|uniref:Uncharacterized protein n=1 Tax=Actinomadura fibrosa TaxID=111802 RepID=A0ABW2XQQ8_9ACTN